MKLLNEVRLPINRCSWNSHLLDNFSLKKKVVHQISYKPEKWFSCRDLVTDRRTNRCTFHIKCSFFLHKECAILEQILYHIIVFYWFPGTNATKIQESQDHILFKAIRLSHQANMKGNIATKHAGLDHHKHYKSDRTHHREVTGIKPVLKHLSN